METQSAILFFAGLGLLPLGAVIAWPGRSLIVYSIVLPFIPSHRSASAIHNLLNKSKEELKQEHLQIMKENPEHYKSGFVFLGLGLLLILASLLNTQFHFIPN